MLGPPRSTKRTSKGKLLGFYKCRCGRRNKRMLSRPMVPTRQQPSRRKTERLDSAEQQHLDSILSES